MVALLRRRRQGSLPGVWLRQPLDAYELVHALEFGVAADHNRIKLLSQSHGESISVGEAVMGFNVSGSEERRFAEAESGLAGIRDMRLERCQHNPILEPDPTRDWESGAVFNCGATIGPDGSVYLLYRAIPRSYTRKPSGEGYDNYVSTIGCAVSDDGIAFARCEQPVIRPTEEYDRFGCEDPRVTRLEIGGQILYLITYTALFGPAYSGSDRVALASTEDFRTFHKHGVVIPGLADKDAVIFPELIRGRIAMLHRVVPNIQIVYFEDLEQLIYPREDFWSAYRASLDEFTVMKPKYEWEAEKIGAGAPPIRTEEGWLLIYHGKDEKGVYRAGMALLDLEDPSRVIARSPYPILEPGEEYERVGDTPNVVFPEGAIVMGDTLYVYYGAADKCCCLATVRLNDLLVRLLSWPT